MKAGASNRPGPLVADPSLANGLGEAPAPVHDCWNTIGIGGNGTCRELQKFVHCRNCSVYSAAGVQLLDRPLSADYRRERTGYYATAKKLSQPARISLVLFRLAAEWLALPTTVFQEVAERRVVHTLPHRQRSLILGLVNIRGELLICVALARLLGLVADPRRDTSRAAYGRLLVTHWNGNRLVFPVDEVHGIQRIQSEELSEPPATISNSALTHTQGVFAWRERTVGFLNVESLFSALTRNLS